jgi:hypothetical protein
MEMTAQFTAGNDATADFLAGAAPEAPATTEAAERIELNINDLAAMKSLIDVVTQRGAFKAGELSSVGVLYDRLSKFLAAVPPAPPNTEVEAPVDPLLLPPPPPKYPPTVVTDVMVDPPPPPN